jgi:hypothetical protein
MPGTWSNAMAHEEQHATHACRQQYLRGARVGHRWAEEGSVNQDCIATHVGRRSKVGTSQGREQ